MCALHTQLFSPEGQVLSQPEIEQLVTNGALLGDQAWMVDSLIMLPGAGPDGKNKALIVEADGPYHLDEKLSLDIEQKPELAKHYICQNAAQLDVSPEAADMMHWPSRAYVKRRLSRRLRRRW